MGEVAQVADNWLTSKPFLGLEPLTTAQYDAITVYRKHAALLQAAAEVAAQNDQVAAMWSGWLGDITTEFARRIRAGQRAGVVRKELSPIIAAKFIVMGSDRLLREEIMTTDGSSDRRVARQVAQAIWSLLHCSQQGSSGDK